MVTQSTFGFFLLPRCIDSSSPWTLHRLCSSLGVPILVLQHEREGFVTPDEELKYLNAELERLKSEHPATPGILRMTDQCLRRCSKWKWEQHGWTISEGQTCGIMNGSDQERRTALLSVLKGQVDQVEFVSGLDMLKVVLGPPTSESA
jgi:hypothetical protein